MDEIGESGLSMVVAGGAVTALGSLATTGTGVVLLGLSGLATMGLTVLGVGVILTAVGIYRTLKNEQVPSAATS